MKKTCIIFLVLFCTLLFMFNSLSYAETNITFAWDMVSTPDLAGFNLYQREDPNVFDYNNPIAIIQDPDVRSYTLNNVSDGLNLFWVLRAYDTDGLESSSSNEVNQNQTGSPSAPSNFRIQVVVDVTVEQ